MLNRLRTSDKFKSRVWVFSSSGTIPLIEACFLFSLALSAHAQTTPEQQAARLGKRLHPITYQQWQGIVGDKFSEPYTVAKGDTLSGISDKLFGSQKYWPKIWALNNSIIKNPHWLEPGYKIALNSSSDSMTDAGGGLKSGTNHRSPQWQSLPRQGWEYGAQEKPFAVDALGFDTRPMTPPLITKSTDPVVFATTEQIAPVGKIIGSPSNSQFLTLGDFVYVESIGSGEVPQTDMTYAVVGDSQALKSRKSDRSGHAYRILGQIKIVGNREQAYIGKIVKAKDSIPRGSLVTIAPSRIPELIPIPGPRPLLATFMADRTSQYLSSAQFQYGYIDRGSDEGIQQGMVFRAYSHADPYKDRKAMSSNFVIQGDVIVTQVQPRLSTVRVMSSRGPLKDDMDVILLTELDDLTNNNGYSLKGALVDDDLDRLDQGNGLTDAEKRELKQLENWSDKPDNGLDSMEGVPQDPNNTLDDPADGLPMDNPEPTLPQEPTVDLDPQTEGDFPPLGDEPETFGGEPPMGELPDPGSMTAPESEGFQPDPSSSDIGTDSGVPEPLAPDTAASPDTTDAPSDNTLPELPDS